MRNVYPTVLIIALLSTGVLAGQSSLAGVSTPQGGATVVMSGDGGVVGFCFFGVGGGINLYCGEFVIVETPSGKIQGHIGPMTFVFGMPGPVTEVVRFNGIFPEEPGLHPAFTYDCVIPPGDGGNDGSTLGGNCRVSNAPEML